jgi:hypothetical protein
VSFFPDENFKINILLKDQILLRKNILKLEQAK